MIVVQGPPSITDWISAAATVLTLGVAVWALFYARGQVSESKKARRQLDDIERKKSEPAVVAYMEPAASPFIQEIVIKNFGPTPAYDVRFISDPPIQRTGDTNRADVDNVDIPAVIPFLAPGQEWRTIWDVSHERSKNEKLADRHEVEVTFKGLDDVELRSRAILDWAPLKTKRFMDTLGVHDLAKAVKDMSTLQKKWSESPRGLQVWIRSGDEKDARRREEARRFRAINEAQREELKRTLEFTSNRGLQEELPTPETDPDQP
ncbi:hypothetical protein KRR55_06310 [Paeniglutamicibacter sp. ABSL32-1]|uniref:hypothetical protein n=1 Tax=Paeniglutamicibacter quisquiliarum TaxID=2849498 RepID=UPI001C2D2188|nr:hypothetical protein [Paeniglutamicibacter quisquiliarum]MBV1778725.1 hypothetical protein [Paeniglutamicibacter quisquiliarum]